MSSSSAPRRRSPTPGSRQSLAPDRSGPQPSSAPGGRASLPAAARSSMAPAGGSLRPAGRQCRRHHLVLRPDGSCVVCDREGGPFASDASGLHRRPRRRRVFFLWLGGALLTALGAGALLWALLAQGPALPSKR